jgi:hypothetical protein
MPRRQRVVLAKVWTSIVVAAGFGAAACGLAAGVGTLALKFRGIDIRLGAGDYALLVGGGAVAAALWAPIGLGVGAVVRNQVPTLIGICAWLLFVEGLLVGDVAGVTAVGRFGPGAAATALTGQQQDTLVAPVAGLVLLTAYAAAGALAGVLSTVRRDVV